MTNRPESMLSGARATETALLFGSGRNGWPTVLQARRSVGRFKSAGFGHRCLSLGQVATGYQLEEKLCAEAAEPFYPSERDHTFDKLIHLGQPWDLDSRLTLGPSTLTKWVERVPDPQRSLTAYRAKPVWRLLLPFWLTESELDSISLELGAQTAALSIPDFDGGGGGGKTYFESLQSMARVPMGFTCADDFGLVSIAQLMLELRYARLLSNLARYAMVLVAIQDVFAAWERSSTSIQSRWVSSQLSRELKIKPPFDQGQCFG